MKNIFDYKIDMGNIPFEVEQNGNRLTVISENDGNFPVEEARITLKYDFKKNTKIFLNGYQSWTDSIERNVDDKLRGLHRVPEFLIKKYAFNSYGDYDFVDYPYQKGKLHGFSYGYIRNGEEYFLIGSLSEKVSYTIIKTDTNNNEITIEKDCDNLYVSKNTKVFDMVLITGSENEVFDEYFAVMKEAYGTTLLQAKDIKGYTSWYDRYENIDEKSMCEQIAKYSQQSVNNKIDVFQIDDGYESKVGDWLSVDNNKFPNGMKNIAERIKAAGITPGIWLAPFVVKTDSEIAGQHPEWLVKNEKGEKILGGNNWGGFYVLNFYNNEVREYISKVFDTFINEWGYEFLKLDFLYAVCIIPQNGKTRGHIMCEAMDFLRELSGNVKLLGCGVPLATAFGKVEYCRIGCDVSLSYDDVWWMRFFHRERASTKNSIGNTIGRRQLNKRAFLNDPDVYLLRDTNIKMTREQKEYLYSVNKKYGSVMFTSDDI